MRTNERGGYRRQQTVAVTLSVCPKLQVQRRFQPTFRIETKI